MDAQQPVHKEVEAMQVACVKAVIENRAEVLPLLDSLRQACGDAICGPPMAIYHYGALKDGLLVEAAFPVSRPVEGEGVQTRRVEAARAWTLVHRGPTETIRETTAQLIEHANARAGTAGGLREVYLALVAEQPECNMTEVQLIKHEWDRLLAEGVEATVGVAARQQVMAGIEELRPESSLEAYAEWIRGAMDRLDALTGDPKDKYEVLSGCAHVFSDHRIARLRSVYEESGEIDDVLGEMYTDPDWYEDPVRQGNVLHMRKVPFDPVGYEAASTPAERRQAYCHCPFVKPYLDEAPPAMSPSFCWCGSGWYRRLWEGILGEPVEIEQVETLLGGYEQCTLTITLPLSLEGEMGPG
jgi:effector-binding domain-containing protein